MTALILHIPHASTLIPPEERKSLLPNDTRLSQELLQMTDAWTDRLVEGVRLTATRIVCPVSRLVVDVERFPEDLDEPMAGKGMGAVYTRLSTGEPLRSLEPAERARLMARWYYPHHAKMTDAVDAALAARGRCLILDIHSFSSRPLPHEPDQDPDRPEICIGTDTFHSPFESDAEALVPIPKRSTSP
jgi:N-formylglutamate deformylase